MLTNSSKYFATLVTVLWLAVYSQTSSAAVEVKNSINDQLSASHIEWFSDETASWDFDKVSRENFERLKSSAIGRQKGNFWVRFRVRNTSTSMINAILENGDRHVEEIEIYIVDSVGTLIHSGVNGRANAFDSRTLQSTTIVFPVVINAGETQTIYLRIDSQFIPEMGPSLQSYDQFFNLGQQASFFTHAFYGVIIGLVLYKVLLWVSTRDAKFAVLACVFLCEAVCHGQ